VLLPTVAALTVSAAVFFATEHGIVDNAALRPLIASLVTLLPGAALTTATVELASGEMIAGSSRLVYGVLQLLLLAFGIVAGAALAGLPSDQALTASSSELLGYAGWIGQIVGNELFGGALSGFVGALAMTPVAYIVATRPTGPPATVTFLPAFWLLVPGALGLIGVTELATQNELGAQDFVNAIGTIISIALGVLCGVTLYRNAIEAPRRLRRLAGRSGDDV
jgi:uncharacterized membrane protein YjjB (DUF3815 family)